MTFIPVEFTKRDKIDDIIQDEAQNIPNVDDSEAIKDLENTGKSKTSETLIKINFFVEMAIEKQKDALVSAVLHQGEG